MRSASDRSQCRPTARARAGSLPHAAASHGLKATLGRVPRTVPPDQFGQLTYLGVMARHPPTWAPASRPSRGHRDDPWERRDRPHAVPSGRRTRRRRSDFRQAHHRDPPHDRRLPRSRGRGRRLESAIAFLDKRGARITEMDGREGRLEARRRGVSSCAPADRALRRDPEHRRGELDPSFARTLDEGDAVDVVALRRALMDRTLAYRSGAKGCSVTPTCCADADGRDAGAAGVAGPVRARWWSRAGRSGGLRRRVPATPSPFNMTGHPRQSAFRSVGRRPVCRSASTSWRPRYE